MRADRLAGGAAPPDGRPRRVAEVAVLCLAGADYPQDERRLAAAAAPFGWADRVVVCNDAFAMLRAGTDNDVGVALVCGAGINCVGRGHRRPYRPVPGAWRHLRRLGRRLRRRDGGTCGGGSRRGRARAADRPGEPGAAPLRARAAVCAGQRRSTPAGSTSTASIELPPLVFAAADEGDERGARDRRPAGRPSWSRWPRRHFAGCG